MTKKTLLIILSIVVVALLIFLYQKPLKEVVERPEKIAEVEEGQEPAAEEARKEEPAKEATGLVALIPSDGFLYIQLLDLKSVYKNIENTNFLNQLLTLKVFDDTRKDIEAFNKDSVIDISFENILKLIGNDLFISMYYEPVKKEPVILFSTVLDETASFAVKAINFLVQINAKEDDKLDVGKETYGDIDINYMIDKEKNEAFYYLVIDDVAHLSSDLKLAKKVVDIVQGKNTNILSKAEKYNKASEHFRSSRFFSVFYDFKSLDDIQETLTKKYAKNQPKIKKTFSSGENYDYLYADAIVDDGVDLTASAHLKDEAAQEYLAFLNDVHLAPTKSGLLDIVKSSPLFYGSYSGIALVKYYDFMMKTTNGKQSPAAGAVEGGFNAITGMSFTDDFLPLISDEFTYMGNGIDMTSPVMPLPKIFFAVKLNDVDKFVKVFDKLNEALAKPENNMNLKTDEYKGYKYAYMMTPLGIVPGHGVISDYYVIFSTTSTFNNIVDDLNTDSVPFFESNAQKVKRGDLDSAYHYFSYFDSKAILQLVPDLFDKYSGLLQGKMSSEERRDFLRKYNDEILPFLDTLKALDRFTSTGLYDKDGTKFTFKLHYTMTDID